MFKQLLKEENLRHRKTVACGGDYLSESGSDEQARYLAGGCLAGVEREIMRIEDKIKVADKEKDEKTVWRLKGLSKQLDILRKLKLAVEMTGSQEELLQILLEFEVANDRKSDNDITTPIIRQIVFLRALSSGHEEYNQKFFAMAGKEKPQKSDLENMVEFVNNVLKQHICPTFDLTAEQNKKLLKILNVTAIKEEISRLDEMISGKKRKLLCVASREILGELSGYYADACWTAVEDAMKKNPKMTACAFISNPGEINAIFR